MRLLWLMAGIAVTGLAAVPGAVVLVRSKASGRIYAESDVPAAPVALALGAKVQPDGTPSAFLTARLDLAKRLYDTGRAEMIMVSGDHLAPEFDEPTAMRNYLITNGLPIGRVIVDPGGLWHLRVLSAGKANLQSLTIDHRDSELPPRPGSGDLPGPGYRRNGRR
jgi:vancomycin permeability regulator SanA